MREAAPANEASMEPVYRMMSEAEPFQSENTENYASFDRVTASEDDDEVPTMFSYKMRVSLHGVKSTAPVETRHEAVTEKIVSTTLSSETKSSRK